MTLPFITTILYPSKMTILLISLPNIVLMDNFFTRAVYIYIYIVQLFERMKLGSYQEVHFNCMCYDREMLAFCYSITYFGYSINASLFLAIWSTVRQIIER